MWISAAYFTEIDARAVQNSQNRCSWANGELWWERASQDLGGDVWWIPGWEEKLLCFLSKVISGKGQGDLQKWAKNGFYYRSYIFQIQTLCLRVCLLFKSMYSANHGKPVVSSQFNEAVKCGLWLTFSVLMPAGTWGYFFFFFKSVRKPDNDCSWFCGWEVPDACFCLVEGFF